MDVLFILISTTAFTIETEPYIEQLGNSTITGEPGGLLITDSFFLIDGFCVIFFSLDLIFKFVTWPQKLAFFYEVLNWLDMAAVAPFYIQVGDFSGIGALTD